MLPGAKETLTWFVVPERVLYSFADPAAFIPSSWFEVPSASAAIAFHPASYTKNVFVVVSYTSNPCAGEAIARRCTVVILGTSNPR